MIGSRMNRMASEESSEQVWEWPWVCLPFLWGDMSEAWLLGAPLGLSLARLTVLMRAAVSEACWGKA